MRNRSLPRPRTRCRFDRCARRSPATGIRDDRNSALSELLKVGLSLPRLLNEVRGIGRGWRSLTKERRGQEESPERGGDSAKKSRVHDIATLAPHLGVLRAGSRHFRHRHDREEHLLPRTGLVPSCRPCEIISAHESRRTLRSEVSRTLHVRPSKHTFEGDSASSKRSDL